MGEDRSGEIAVIFTSVRTAQDAAGYAAAAIAMDRLAREQPGFRGMEAVRDADGLGITVSYWADEGSAQAWKNQVEHRAIRQRGRERWYQSYRVTIARVERGYAWQRS